MKNERAGGGNMRLGEWAETKEGSCSCHGGMDVGDDGDRLCAMLLQDPSPHLGVDDSTVTFQAGFLGQGDGNT